jgi:hypothetical protein
MSVSATEFPSTTWEPEAIESNEEEQSDQVISNPVEPAPKPAENIKDDEQKLSWITWIFYVICMVVGVFIFVWICITLYDWWYGTSYGSGYGGGGGSLGDYVMMGVLMS